MYHAACHTHTRWHTSQIITNTYFRSSHVPCCVPHTHDEMNRTQHTHLPLCVTLLRRTEMDEKTSKTTCVWFCFVVCKRTFGSHERHPLGHVEHCPSLVPVLRDNDRREKQNEGDLLQFCFSPFSFLLSQGSTRELHRTRGVEKAEAEWARKEEKKKKSRTVLDLLRRMLEASSSASV